MTAVNAVTTGAAVLAVTVVVAVAAVVTVAAKNAVFKYNCVFRQNPPGEPGAEARRKLGGSRTVKNWMHSCGKKGRKKPSC